MAILKIFSKRYVIFANTFRVIVENLEKLDQEDRSVWKIILFDTGMQTTLNCYHSINALFISGDPGVQGDTGSRGFPG